MLISSARDAKVEMVSALLMGASAVTWSVGRSCGFGKCGKSQGNANPRGISAGSAFALGQQKAGDGDCETEQLISAADQTAICETFSFKAQHCIPLVQTARIRRPCVKEAFELEREHARKR